MTAVYSGLLFDGVKEVEEFFGFFAAFLGVADQGDAMGAFAVDHFGIAGEDRFNDFGVTEHGVDEKISAGTLRDEIGGDFSVSDVSGGPDCGFKVAVCPIPDGIEEGGVLGEKFFDFVELTMSDGDEFLDKVGGQGGFAVLGFGRSCHDGE